VKRASRAFGELTYCPELERYGPLDTAGWPQPFAPGVLAANHRAGPRTQIQPAPAKAFEASQPATKLVACRPGCLPQTKTRRGNSRLGIGQPLEAWWPNRGAAARTPSPELGPEKENPRRRKPASWAATWSAVRGLEINQGCPGPGQTLVRAFLSFTSIELLITAQAKPAPVGGAGPAKRAEQQQHLDGSVLVRQRPWP